MKVGYLQFEPKLNQLSENIQNITLFLSYCEDFDLVVLPELANSGYNFSSKEEALANAEEINNSKYIALNQGELKTSNMLKRSSQIAACGLSIKNCLT